ncbi:hypothetical protein ACLOJK_037487 [Asimina triloba]
MSPSCTPTPDTAPPSLHPILCCCLPPSHHSAAASLSHITQRCCLPLSHCLTNRCLPRLSHSLPRCRRRIISLPRLSSLCCQRFFATASQIPTVPVPVPDSLSLALFPPSLSLPSLFFGRRPLLYPTSAARFLSPLL